MCIKILVLVINVVWMFSVCDCFYLLCNQQHACLHTSQTIVFVIFQMKKKTKVAILASVASVLPMGVALLRKLQCRHGRLPRALYVNHAIKRKEYINSILHGSERYCVNQIRMKPITFHHLCHILTEGEHVRPTIHMSVTKQVFIFLHITGHNVRFRVMGSRICRSTETIHRYFKVVLRGVLKLYRALIRLRSEDTPPKIRNSRRFYPYFKVNITTCVFL